MAIASSTRLGLGFYRILIFAFLVCNAVAEEANQRDDGDDTPLSTDAAAAQEVESFKLKFDGFTIFTFFIIALSLIIASASGIGGGGILVPLYILMLGAPGKVAIPLSNVTILGGGIGNNIFNLQKRHPLKDRPMIDYDTVVMLEPLTIFGAVLGSFLNKILPDFLLIMLLAASLGLTAYRTMGKGIQAWKKETLAMEEEEAGGGPKVEQKSASDKKGDFVALSMDENEDTLDDDDEVNLDHVNEFQIEQNESNGSSGSVQMTKMNNALKNMSNKSNGQNPNDDEEEGGDQNDYDKLPEAGGSGGPTDEEFGESDFNNVMSVGRGVGGDGTESEGEEGDMTEREIKDAALAIIEEEERHHPIGKIVFLTICFIGVMSLDYMKDLNECGTPPFWLYTGLTIPWAFGFTLLYRQYLTKRHNLKVKMGYEFVEGDVHWDDRATLLYPLLCTAAGVLAGLFGVGGGMIKGPLVLEMGLTPLQAHATGMFMILFTSGSACVAFFLFGQLNFDAGVPLFFMGLGCTAVGQFGFDQLFKKNKRQSMIVLCMATVITLSAGLLTLRSVFKANESVQAGHSAELFSFGTLCGIKSI
mmetsp:Transcript_34669/g.44714  ORF Transcript_34669/g.44714 Transcript_34669/m.44714 type:complete len:587 (+) Transcript_34669:14-1774(+)